MVDKLLTRSYTSSIVKQHCRGNTMGKNFKLCVEAVHTMSADEINTLVEAIKLRRTQLARTSVRSLCVGDLVQFSGKSGSSTRGRVIKLNRKTAVVDCGLGGKWRVTASMLTPV